VVQLLLEEALLGDFATDKATDHWSKFAAVVNDLLNRNISIFEHIYIQLKVILFKSYYPDT